MNNYSLKHIKFEDFLGRNISDFTILFDVDFRRNTFNKNDFIFTFHSNINYINEPFYDIFYNHITITTDENNIIKTITLHFREVINREFYNSLNYEYGEPNAIQIISNRKLESKTIIKDEHGKTIETLKKNTFDLREGSFEEKPLFILWEKESFQLKALLKHNQSRSQMTFSIIDRDK
jgi:hypothetical protein